MLFRRIGLIVMILLPLAVVGFVAVTSHKIESRLFWQNTTSADAYNAALEYLHSAPALRGASNFSQPKDTVVERWGPTRWRVAGYVDTQAAGGKVHTFYSCVLHYAGRERWEVEDLHFERLQ